MQQTQLLTLPYLYTHTTATLDISKAKNQIFHTTTKQKIIDHDSYKIVIINIPYISIYALVEIDQYICKRVNT